MAIMDINLNCFTVQSFRQDCYDNVCKLKCFRRKLLEENIPTLLNRRKFLERNIGKKYGNVDYVDGDKYIRTMHIYKMLMRKYRMEDIFLK